MNTHVTTVSWNSGYTLPTANQYVILYDSTRRGLASEAVANSTSLIATAGSFRGKLASCRLDLIVGSVTQDVTFVRQIWDGTAWQTVNSGSDTLTAGTLYPYGWVPEAPDFRIYLLAGGTAPSAVLFQCAINTRDRAGGT